MDEQVAKFNDAILAELAKALALLPTRRIKALIRSLVGRGSLNFSRLMVEFDRQIHLHGSRLAARWLLPNFCADFKSTGEQIIPSEGPLLVVSNHPAAFDSILISAFIDRPDYKAIVGDVPPYHFLPNLCRHAIFSPESNDAFGRMRTVRESIKHLLQGGALLIFPRGGIEPDPQSMPAPDVEFPRWSRSLEIFVRRVPQTRILVSMVSGVIAPQALRHPITWLRQARSDRQRLAFMYQFIRQLFGGKEHFGLVPRVTFGEVLSSMHPESLLNEVEQAAWRTLEQHMHSINSSSPAV